MKPKYLVHALTLAGLGIGMGGPALAHICNVDIGAGDPTYCGDSPNYTVYTPEVQDNGALALTTTANPIPAGFAGDPACPYGGTDSAGTPCNYVAGGLTEFTGYGWLLGTTPALSDSHSLHSGVLFTFHLDHTTAVRISYANDAAYNTAQGVGALDPAFSLYAGTLPDDGHDDNAYDPAFPGDGDCGLPIASTADRAPGDPGIPKYLVDPATCAATANPAFTSHVQKKYAKLYKANNRYRDTLNYTQTGGLDAADNPLHLFNGQFNALGGWSVANEDAIPGDPNSTLVFNPNGTRSLLTTLPDGSQAVTWSEIRFLAAQNDHTGGAAETLAITLPTGDYTVAASGANCNDQTSACIGPLYGGKLSFKKLSNR